MSSQITNLTRIPAFIVVKQETAGLQIAALSVLDRLIVAIDRGGAGPITVVAEGQLPPLKRTLAQRIPFQTVGSLPSNLVQALFATTNLLVQSKDIRRCIDQAGRLRSPEGTLLEVGVGTSPESINGAKPVLAEGVACRIQGASDAAIAEKLLWKSMTSSSDGLVDRVFNRPCGRPLSKLLIHTPITPNTVSMASILIGVLSAFLFATGEYAWMIAGALLFQLSAIIDCVDGDIARVVFKESPLGKWLDLIGDQVVHTSVFIGIAWGLSRTTPGGEVWWLGISAVAGALISFAVVLRGMRLEQSPNSPVQKLVDAATNRDFSVLVLILACFGKLKLFLWLSAIGSHVFWIVALGLQLRHPRENRA